MSKKTPDPEIENVEIGASFSEEEVKHRAVESPPKLVEDQQGDARLRDDRATALERANAAIANAMAKAKGEQA